MVDLQQIETQTTKHKGENMITAVNFNSFVQSFADYGREDNFSREGLGYLFKYLEGYEEDTGEQLYLDVIALCCEHSEYARSEYVIAAYSHNQEFADVDPKDLEALRELLEGHTTVICCKDDCIIIKDF